MGKYDQKQKVAYIATFKSTGSTSLNPAAVISASKDIYESLSPIHAASTPMERTKIESK
jgi:hypothetical protein